MEYPPASHPGDQQSFHQLNRLNPVTRKTLAIDLVELGDDYVSAALRVSFKFETIGLLIHKGVVPMDAMADLVEGAAILIWNKLKRTIEESRASQDHELLFEWFQWLAERLEERDENVRSPAFKAHRDWSE